MAIKSFSPEMSGAANRKITSLEEKILNSETAIPHAAIKEYADYIIGELSALKDFEDDDMEDEISFVIDALSEERVQDSIFHEVVDGSLSEDEVRTVVNRIRRALVEELKGRIDEKIYLGIKDFVNTQQISESTITGRNLPNLPEEKKKNVVKSLHNKNIIRQALDINNDKSVVYKNQERAVDESYEETLREAMDLFVALEPHPNIIKVLENDPKNKRALYEHRSIKTLPEYAEEHQVDFYRNPKEFARILMAVKGCMEGANYLAENNLVLQDIKPSNIGVEVEDSEVKGVLFDLEGLIKQGVLESKRIYAKGYQPPETKEDNIVVMPDEMTYQFGVSIKALMQKCVGAFMPEPGKFDISEMLLKQKIIKDLKVLSEHMSKKSPADRIYLPSAIAELESIIERVKNIAV